MNINTMLIKMIILLVFIGWLLMWVLLPTKDYKLKWSVSLATKLNTTYFGKQGTNLVIFSIPMMLLAALGCGYLHFHKKWVVPRSDRSGVKFLKQPVLVMAPLGIVTASDLIFSSMFIALLIWSLANYLNTSFNHHLHMRVGDKLWQAKFRSVSLRLGYVGNICWAFLFFPVTRGSSLLPLVGLTSESSIKYHIWLGHLSNILFLAHTVGFIIYWAMTNQMVELLEWSQTYVSNLAGAIAIVIAIPMWITSFPYFRRKMFEVFFYTHHLYLVYIVFYVLHVGDYYFCLILPGIFLFAIDRYLRFLQSWRRARLLSARILPCGVVELNFSKAPGLYYNPTSILFVKIPRISKLQWHPFTISSNCNTEPDTLSILIKSEGSWSQKVYKELSSPLDYLEVSTEGPYGPNSSSFLRHELLVMVSGGSGIAPFISIIREIIFNTKKPNSKIPKVLLISTFKHSSELSMLDILLPKTSIDPTQITQIPLQIKAYITREKEQQSTNTKIQTKWFKPNPLDSPISAALGTNNWLWLGAIILSSFLMFLLLLGLVTRYYIFPKDHNTGKIYHFSYRALWDMFLCCVCVFAVSSLVFVWRKRKNVMQGNQIQNMELQTPASSPGPWFCGADEEAEVESFPHESLVLATEVQYGSRPNLKKLLLDCKEADVGVLVCGPREMRHQVAKICSSRPAAKKLHFEAISFNW